MKALRIGAIFAAVLLVVLLVTLLWQPPSLEPVPTQTATATRLPTPTALIRPAPASEPGAGTAAAPLDWQAPLLIGLLALFTGLLPARNARARLTVLLASLWLAALYALGGGEGLILGVATAVLVFYLMVVAARGSFAGNPLPAMADYCRLLWGITQASETVEECRSTMKGRASPLAPRTVTIKPYNAVIFEQGSQQTRICGPDKLTAVPSTETIKQYYNLRPRQEDWTFQTVLTKDMIPTTVAVTVTYRINVAPRAARGEKPFTDVEKRVIQQVDTLMPDWPRGTRMVVAESVRTAIAELELDKVREMQVSRELERNIRQRARRAAQAFGVTIDGLLVENIQPERQVVEAATGNWLAAQLGQAAATTDRARILAWEQALMRLAGAYKTAINAGMPLDAIQWESWRRTLEQVAKDIQVTLPKP